MAERFLEYREWVSDKELLEDLQWKWVLGIGALFVSVLLEFDASIDLEIRD